MPPRVFLVCLLGGAVVEWFFPTGPAIASSAPWWVPPAVGIVIAGAGFAFMGWGHGRFVSVGTAVKTCRPASELVTGGAYRFSRNPMYVGFIAVLLGFGVAVGSLAMTLSAAAMFFYLDRYMVPREERYLRSRFGEAYDAYRRDVRRWL